MSIANFENPQDFQIFFASQGTCSSHRIWLQQRRCNSCLIHQWPTFGNNQLNEHYEHDLYSICQFTGLPLTHFCRCRLHPRPAFGQWTLSYRFLWGAVETSMTWRSQFVGRPRRRHTGCFWREVWYCRRSGWNAAVKGANGIKWHDNMVCLVETREINMVGTGPRQTAARYGRPGALVFNMPWFSLCFVPWNHPMNLESCAISCHIHQLQPCTGPWVLHTFHHLRCEFSAMASLLGLGCFLTWLSSWWIG